MKRVRVPLPRSTLEQTMQGSVGEPIDKTRLVRTELFQRFGGVCRSFASWYSPKAGNTNRKTIQAPTKPKMEYHAAWVVQYRNPLFPV